MKYILTLLICAFVFSSSAAQLISFSPFKISFTPKANKVWWYNSGTCDSLFQKNKPSGSNWSKTKLVFVTYYKDGDGDKFGDAAISTRSCHTVTGYVTDKMDCNDSNASVWKIGDFNIDLDGDGYSTGTATVCYGATIPSGYSDHTLGTDCDDLDALKWQTGIFYIDMDGDGYDAGQVTLCYGVLPTGYVTTTLGSDCNDNDRNNHSQNYFYVDANGDTYGDSDTQVLLCADSCPAGYTTNPPKPAQLFLISTGYEIGRKYKDLGFESALYNTKNFYIDITTPTYVANVTALGNDLSLDYGGSSIGHSNVMIDGDTITSGHGMIGNGYNGLYIKWGKTYNTSFTCDSMNNQGWVSDGNVLDGANCIDWPTSFNPLIVNYCHDHNLSLTIIYNANANQIKPFLNFLKWVIVTKKVKVDGVYFGAELSGKNYTNAGDFPNGGTDYVNKVVNPLCDSLNKRYPTILTGAWANQTHATSSAKWNDAVRDSKAQAIEVYLLLSYIGTPSSRWTFQQMLDSFDYWLGTPTYNYLDFYKPIGKIYAGQQWNLGFAPEVSQMIGGTFLETVTTSMMFHSILSYDYANLNLMSTFYYNGAGRGMNMMNEQPSNTYYSIKNCYAILETGATRYDVTAQHGLEGDATLVGSEYRIHLWNNSGVPQSITAISIDGKIYTNFTATGFIVANSLDDKVLKFQDIVGGQFPAFFDGVITIKK